MSWVETVPTDVLDDVDYLSRSENRVRVLEALTRGSHSTRNLRDLTGTSKTTLHRILGEFEDRLWVERTTDGEYAATPQAEHVAVQFRAFLDSMAAIRDLGEDVRTLPAAELTLGPDAEVTVGLQHFREATVEHKQPQAQGIGRRQLVETFRESSATHVFMDIAPPHLVEEILQERVENGEMAHVGVMTGDLFEYLRDDHEWPPLWKRIAEAGSDLYRYDGGVPANLVVGDERTLIWPPTTEPRRGVISRDETVRQWALDVIQRYREQAEPLNPESFD
jgi:predicted transcriptional regulator